jgi:hypothetical protein
MNNWNRTKATRFNLDSVKKEDMPFLQPFGRFLKVKGKTTRCFSKENFCDEIGISVEDHIEKVSTAAKENGYSVYFLDDINFKDLPLNQVEFLFALFENRGHLIEEGASMSSPMSSKSLNFTNFKK